MDLLNTITRKQHPEGKKAEAREPRTNQTGGKGRQASDEREENGRQGPNGGGGQAMGRDGSKKPPIAEVATAAQVPN